MTRRMTADTPPMIDQIAASIAKAEGGNIQTDGARYRRLALAALKPLTRPSEAMIDAAHEAVWFDAHWAINSRTDFKGGQGDGAGSDEGGQWRVGA